MSLHERQAYFDAAADLTPLLSVRTTRGAVFLVRTGDQHIGRSLYAKRDRGEMAVLSRAVRGILHFHGPAAVRERTFLDVGANIGTTVVTALQDFEFGDGIAFEPEPENYETLVLNLVLNDLDDRVVATQIAVSDAGGTADLVVDRSRSGKHWINSAGLDTSANVSVLRVPKLSLDDLAAMRVFHSERVGLLWIDAQGHEGFILRGAGELCRRGCPLVLEWDPSSLEQSGSMDLLRDILAANYTHFVDLTINRGPGEPPFDLRPMSALDAFTGLFVGPSAQRSFTDILVLALDAEQAELTDLSSMAIKVRGGG